MSGQLNLFILRSGPVSKEFAEPWAKPQNLIMISAITGPSTVITSMRNLSNVNIYIVDQNYGRAYGVQLMRGPASSLVPRVARVGSYISHLYAVTHSATA